MKKISITQSYRDQLKLIAQGIDTSANSLLNILTTDQLNEVLDNHKHISWSNPNDFELMHLSGISKQYNGEWLLSFNDPDIDSPRFVLHELDINDILGLMQTCENTLTFESIANEKVA